MAFHIVLRRLVAALLVLASFAPLQAVCSSASIPGEPMAGMDCCKALAPSQTGSVEKDCCRMNERLPEDTPVAPLPTRTAISTDIVPVLVALPAPALRDDTRAHFDLQSARGRPHAPSHLLASALLI